MPSGPTPSQARFVTATQQVLALAVVCAALTPAIGVVSLDVVAEAPDTGSAAPVALMSAYGEEALKASKLPGGPVSAKLREVPLTAPATRAFGVTAAIRPRVLPRTGLVSGTSRSFADTGPLGSFEVFSASSP